MQLHIKLNPVTDGDLIRALHEIHAGKRAERIRDALTQAFVGGPDLAQAIHRLAGAIERHELPTGQGAVAEKANPTVDRTSPEFRAKLKKSALGPWGG